MSHSYKTRCPDPKCAQPLSVRAGHVGRSVTCPECGREFRVESFQAADPSNDVTMAWGITIYDHNSHSMAWQQRQKITEHFYRTYGTPQCFADIDWTDVATAPIMIKDRVWIGFGASILKGVTIGEGAVVGACSVVRRDVEPYTVVAGNPAVLVRRLPTPDVDAISKDTTPKDAAPDAS